MSDVVTTIKEYHWIWAPILTIVLNAFFVSGWGRRRIIWAWALGRKYGLEYLKKRRARLQQLHDSPREYCGWLLTGVLWVLALLGFQLALEGYMAGIYRFQPATLQLAANITLDVERCVMGLVVYTIAIGHVLDNRVLRRHFDRTVARMDDAIAKLEAKLAVHEGAAAA
jgi:hypothetical protein